MLIIIVLKIMFNLLFSWLLDWLANNLSFFGPVDIGQEETYSEGDHRDLILLRMLRL
jgi:hypothetical protein